MTWTHNYVSNTAYFVSMKKECLFKHAQTRPPLLFCSNMLLDCSKITVTNNK